MSGVEVVSKIQRIIVDPPSDTAEGQIKIQRIIVESPAVIDASPKSTTQTIVVSPTSSVRIEPSSPVQQSIDARPNRGVSIVNAGPPGPPGKDGVDGVQGPPGPAGSVEQAGYVHQQNDPASIWGPVQHNLGFYPNIFLQDSAGTTILGFEIIHHNVNSLSIDVGFDFGGKAYLS